MKRVFITHHHADQCAGLAAKRTWPFVIHAPAGAQPLIDPDGVKHFWKTRRANGVPAGYDVVEKGIANVRFDLAGFTDQFWHTRRIRFLDTPGHGRRAVSIIIDMPREGSGKTGRVLRRRGARRRDDPQALPA